MTREEAEAKMRQQLREAHEWAENNDFDAAAMCAEAALEAWRELPTKGQEGRDGSR